MKPKLHPSLCETETVSEDMSEQKKPKVVSYLSEELLMEITKRLPVKYILRCRSVQKSWYRLLRSPHFISLHSRHQNSLNKYLLFSNRNEKYFSLRFDDKQCKEHYELRFPQEIQKVFESKGDIVYETCNGLMCLSAYKMDEVYLWNPALRVFNVLPDYPIPADDSLTNSSTLGVAFGYMAKTNDYKVIIYKEYICNTGAIYYVYVYSPSTDSWKTVKKAKFGRIACDKLSNSVVVNGVAYWVGSLFEKVIVCFDMEHDTIRELMLPSPYSKHNAESDLLVENSIFGELLSLFYYDRSTYVLHIWVLENAGEPNEGWRKKTSLNFEPSWRPLGFRNNGEMVLRGSMKFVSYDFEKNEAKDMVDDDSLDAFDRGGTINCYPHQALNRFKENLILLDVNRQA